MGLKKKVIFVALVGVLSTAAFLKNWSPSATIPSQRVAIPEVQALKRETDKAVSRIMNNQQNSKSVASVKQAAVEVSENIGKLYSDIVMLGEDVSRFNKSLNDGGALIEAKIEDITLRDVRVVNDNFKDGLEKINADVAKSRKDLSRLYSKISNLRNLGASKDELKVFGKRLKNIEDNLNDLEHNLKKLKVALKKFEKSVLTADVLND